MIVNRLLLVRVLIVKLTLGPKPKWTQVSGKAGAAVYRTMFNRAWSKTYPFIVGVKAEPFKLLCTICQRQIACEKGMWKGTIGIPTWEFLTPVGWVSHS